MNQLDFLTSKIVAKRAERSAEQAVLVGVSGIDAGGKGFISEKIAQRLQESGWRVATINADDWLNLPEVCLSRHKPAEHFYEHAMRFDEMFDRLIVPLKQNRAVTLVAECADAKGSRRKHRYEFRKIDIILLEGIFLFRPAYRNCFDGLFVRDRVETRDCAVPGGITARRNDPGFHNNLLSRTAHPFRKGQSAGCR